MKKMRTVITTMETVTTSIEESKMKKMRTVITTMETVTTSIENK